MTFISDIDINADNGYVSGKYIFYNDRKYKILYATEEGFYCREIKIGF